LAIVLALLALRLPVAGAHETDQYTLPIGREFADLRFHFSRMAHDAIATAVKTTNAAIAHSLFDGRPTQETERLQSADFIAGAVWAELFAAIPTNELFDLQLGSGAMRARYPGLLVAYRPEQHVYDDPLLLVDVTKAVRTFFRSSTVNVGGTLLGTDKFLHFIHLGRIYHAKYLGERAAGVAEEEAVARAVELSAGNNVVLSENGLLGLVTTGIRSNADLAANYAGFKFYRNLTEPVRMGPAVLPPMLAREGAYWRLDARVHAGSDFFAAFFTPHFNEALNPNSYLPLVDARVQGMLRSRCLDVVDWYRDERGRRRGREQFEAVAKELSTLYGEPYGYQDDGARTVSVATTCFAPDGTPVGPPAPATHAAVAQSTGTQWPGADRFGRTELWWAARDGRVDAVVRLLAEVEDPNAADVDGEGPLHAAARGGHATVIRLLIESGADPRRPGAAGSTPLHLAVAAARADAAAALLAGGADVNARDAFSRTPLHRAALQGDRELATLLLESGADPAAVFGARTAAQLAAHGGHATLAQWIAAYPPRPLAGTRNAAPAAATPRSAHPRLPRIPVKPEARRPGSPLG